MVQLCWDYYPACPVEGVDMNTTLHIPVITSPGPCFTRISAANLVLALLFAILMPPALAFGETSSNNETAARGEATSSFAGGSGTANDPYRIVDVNQLQAINSWAYTNAHFVLDQDIDASETADWNNDQGFEPISNNFNGSLDGQGYTISGLTINRPGDSNVALFAATGTSASFSNFHIANASITGDTRTAALAGRMEGSVTHVSAQGSIEGGDKTGGLFGVLTGDAANTSFDGTVEGTAELGGLTGRLEHGNISDSQADAVVNGSGNRIGGLVGWNNQGSIENTSSGGSVNGGGNEVGGLVGHNAGPMSQSHSISNVTGGELVGGLVGHNHNSTIDESFSTGEVNGHENVGGLAGLNAWESAVIKNSYAESAVSASGNLAGGLVGHNNQGSIEGSQALGNVSGTDEVGGLAGKNSSGDISDSSAEGIVTGGDDVGGLIGHNHNGTISNAHASGEVNGNKNVGGLVGYTAWSSALITNSYSSAEVIGEDQNVGGLVGYNRHSTIEGSHATGDVSSHNENVGGLVGLNDQGMITTSFSTGDVSGSAYIGGLAGLSVGWSARIKFSFSLSDVYATGNQVGGLIGEIEHGRVNNSFARGFVAGNNRVGGLIGHINEAVVEKSYAAGTIDPTSSGNIGLFAGRAHRSTISDSFYDEEISAFPGVGQGSNDGVMGKTTYEMTTVTTFTNAGWDFDEDWTIDPGQQINDGYPYLQAAGFPGVFNVFYSRKNGSWDDASTWSTNENQQHDGPAAQSAPGPNDEVQIGDGHTVTLTGNVAVAQGLVRVKNTGTLDAGTHVLTGVGTFQLEAGGTLITANTEGIATSADEGSIQTGTRHFDEGANYQYNGASKQLTGTGLPVTVNDLIIENAEGVEAVKDHIVNGELILTEGTLTMPPGASLVTYEVTGNGNVLMQQEISGGKGWRLVTSPVDGISFDEFFDGFVTQGFEGAAYCAAENYPLLQPNILWFDETQIGTTNMGWRAPDQANELLVPGRGYFQYVFDGAGLPSPYEEEAYFDELDPSITLKAKGREPVFDNDVWTVNITYTARDDIEDPDEGEPFLDVNMEDAGWNLIGNPTTASLDWGKGAAWTRSNMNETFYVWVASAENGSDNEMTGEYHAWNELIADIPEGFTPLSDGLIAPFQGFWIRATDEQASLALTHDAKAIGGDFYQKEHQDKSDPADSKAIVLPLLLKAEGMTSRAYVTFSDTGHPGTDPYDGYRLEPLSNNYLEVYTANLETFSPLTINNLPAEPDNNLRIPLFVGGIRQGQPVTSNYSLQWRLPDNWPADWGLALMDHHEEKAIPLTHQQEYHFHHQSTTSVKKSADAGFTYPEHIVRPTETPTKAKQKGSNRFTLVATPGSPDDDPVYTPDTPSLLPPYPNPTHAEVHVPFNLPEESHVTIRVYDLHGRLVTTLADRKFDSGHHTLPAYSLQNQNSGVYVITLQTSSQKDSRKITLIK